MLIFVQNLLQNKAQSRRESALNELRIVKGKKIFFCKEKGRENNRKENLEYGSAEILYYILHRKGRKLSFLKMKTQI